MKRYAVFVVALFWVISPVFAQEAWQDELRNFRGLVELTAPEGYALVAAPSASSAAKERVAGPAKVTVAGFVEKGGKRFYLAEEARRRWIETGEAPAWIVSDGSERLPALPRLLKRGPGEDPDSGETVTVEAYEEVVPIEAESRWPIAPAPATKFFPAALTAIGGDEAGNTKAFFQLFLNSNGSTNGYPFADPSYEEMTSGQMGASIRLYSRPSVVNTVLLISGESPVLPLLVPGLVFLAGLDEGKIVSLALGGDAWSESAPVSRLGAPVVQMRDQLVFGFVATTLAGPGATLAVKPKRIAGADYTQYDLISQMGAPFDEYSPPEFQHNWTLEISGDLSTTLLAPLYDGRGAPGMIELEGLSLDPAPPAPDPDNFTDEQFAAFRDQLPGVTDPAAFGEGWRSLLKSKLGEIPASQRVPETDGGEF